MYGALDLGIDRVGKVRFEKTNHLGRLCVKLTDVNGHPVGNVMVPMDDAAWWDLLQLAATEVMNTTDADTFPALVTALSAFIVHTDTVPS